MAPLFDAKGRGGFWVGRPGAQKQKRDLDVEHPCVGWSTCLGFRASETVWLPAVQRHSSPHLALTQPGPASPTLFVSSNPDSDTKQEATNP